MMNLRHNSRGFSLLEMILAVSLFSTLMMAIFNILQGFSERELARSTAKYMTTVSKAVEEILDNPQNFNALYNAAVANGGGYQLIADPAGAAIDNVARDFQVGSAAGPWIGASTLLNGNFRSVTPINTGVRILLRTTDNTAVETDTRALEVIVVTTAPRPDKIIGYAADYLGAAGGWIRDFNGKANAVMASAFASWRVTPSSRLAGTTWYTGDLVNTLVADTDGSYLVHYAFANLEDKMGDYLYRQPDVDTAGRRNTMFGPLNLGGNDIVGADNVNVGSAAPKNFNTVPGSPVDCANGVLCVNGTAVVKGSAYVGGFMTVNGNAAVADTMQAGAMRIENAMNAANRTNYNAQNLLVVDGPNAGQDSVNFGGNATIEDGMTISNAGTVTGGISGTELVMPQGSNFTTTNITGSRRIAATTITSDSLEVQDQLKAGIITNGAVSVTGKVGVIDVRNATNLVYNKVLSVPRVSIDSMSVNSFGACSNGCGQ